ncbi:type II toxin-antitoxin system RelE/ParE family toxin [Rhizobium vallis]|uniref:Type II toxin-antitoxin system RelE/ParE family toxin n=1 Tax=Rhizobium vallis TaxID=634290 RepID=A0A3S0QUR2_9HYPH|nr:type II toxin-antitoxin system RelE/ParE family toxin [Rhizobium vallis]RUM24341.1 type II toxin-antitoxin system RelE/ParE family toxin [Rhizobium vallis]
MKEIAWVKAALKDFGDFPKSVQDRMKDALAIAGMGQKADIAKPMKGLGSGVFEIALPYRTDAYRAIYAVQLGDAIWVVHAFQKKSTKGIATPQKDVELIQARLKRIKEMLR